MHRFARATNVALLALVVVAAAAAPALARSPKESHVYFKNNTNSYVWVTAYDGNYSLGTKPQLGAWCVGPHKYDQHGLNAEVGEVRAEVSTAGCQRHPVLLNELRGFPFHTGYDSNTMTYYVHYTGGKYVYNNTP
jgi:hypothetical protein